MLISPQLNFYSVTLIELEQKLEGGTETQNLDFKADMPWSVVSFAKDILAMSNVRDGGDIVIGVREEGIGFLAEGVSQDNAASYKIDTMRDQMHAYADPSADFIVYRIKNNVGKEFIVIRVFSFKETPILCRKDHPEARTKANTIYYRNTNKRIESAAVSNANDLRDIIELSAVRILKRRQDFGFKLLSEDLDKLTNELEGL